MKNWIKENIISLVNFLIVCITVGIFFFQPGYIFFTDYVTGPHVKPDIVSGWFLLDGFFAVASRSISAAFLEKCLIAGTVFALLVSGNQIARLVSNNKIVITFSGLFFLFNPFVYERMLFGQIGVLLGFAFFVLGFAECISYLKNKKSISLVWLGLFWGIAILMSHHYLFIGSAVIVVLAVFFFKEIYILVKEKTFVKHFFSAIGICLLINATWIGAALMPGYGLTTKTAQISEQDFKIFEMSGDSGAEAVGLGALMSGFWGKDQHRFIDITENKDIWGRGFVVLLPLLLCGVYVLLEDRFKQKLLGVLVVVFFTALLLALGTKSSITSGVTFWLVHHIPFYVGMRETSKWISLIVITYGTLFVFGFEWLLSQIESMSAQFGIVVVFGLAIVLQAPLLLFGFYGQVPPVSYPKEWTTVDQIIQKENSNCDQQTLFLPWHLYMSFDWIPRVIQNPANKFFTCPVVSGTNMEWGTVYDNSGNPVTEGVQLWLVSHGENTNALIKSMPRLKYVILSKSLEWNEYDAWLSRRTDAHIIFDGASVRLYSLD